MGAWPRCIGQYSEHSDDEMWPTASHRTWGGWGQNPRFCIRPGGGLLNWTCGHCAYRHISLLGEGGATFVGGNCAEHQIEKGNILTRKHDFKKIILLHDISKEKLSWAHFTIVWRLRKRGNFGL